MSVMSGLHLLDRFKVFAAFPEHSCEKTLPSFERLAIFMVGRNNLCYSAIIEWQRALPSDPVASCES